MDNRTGEIMSEEEMNRRILAGEDRSHYQLIDSNSVPEYHGTPIKISKNDKCPCGSMKKFKNCCWEK